MYPMHPLPTGLWRGAKISSGLSFQPKFSLNLKSQGQNQNATERHSKMIQCICNSCRRFVNASKVIPKHLPKSSLQSRSFILGRKKENREGKKRGGGGGGGEENMSLHGNHCIQRTSAVKSNAAI